MAESGRAWKKTLRWSDSLTNSACYLRNVCQGAVLPTPLGVAPLQPDFRQSARDLLQLQPPPLLFEPVWQKSCYSSYFLQIGRKRGKISWWTTSRLVTGFSPKLPTIRQQFNRPTWWNPLLDWYQLNQNSELLVVKTQKSASTESLDSILLKPSVFLNFPVSSHTMFMQNKSFNHSIPKYKTCI